MLTTCSSKSCKAQTHPPITPVRRRAATAPRPYFSY